MQANQLELATEWFDGRSPRPHRAWLRCEGSELIVRLSEEQARVDRRYVLRGIRWPERRSHGLRQTELPDGSLIQHADAREWDAWAQGNGLRESAIVGWMQSWRGALGAMVSTVVFLAAAWVWGVPLLSTAIAHSIPHSVEASIGEASLKQLRALFLKPSELPDSQQTKLRQGFAALVQNAYPEGDAPAWQLSFHKSKALGANAFALPGGQIVITDELVNMLDDVPDAVLGILAHELGHVEHRHGLDLMVRASLVSAMVGVVIGDASGFLATVPATLATQAYSRDAERQSDAQAAHMLHASGISPAFMATFFERLRDNEASTRDGSAQSREPSTEPGVEEGSASLPIAISSHPDHAERIRFFRNWTPSGDKAARRAQ
jgi:Zn-dependent protease with chaperone function